jgi:hypothetical protein
MAPRTRTRQEIIDLLGRAVWEAERAEVYHEAAADPRALKGRTAQQACDAAAMQLIEPAGCAEDFTRDRGDPGTTLSRFDDALRPVFEVRTPHTHPEMRLTLPPLTPRRLSAMIDQLKTSVGNLDADTLRIQPRVEMQALSGIAVGLVRIEKDGLSDPTALRPRDLHYAGYYREIQFGRLAKATGLYDNRGKSQDARQVDINRSIFDADNMAHKFHVMRGGPDKSILPESVVGPEHRDRRAGRSLSELMRELRDEYQTPAERLAELEIAETRRARGEYRTAVEELADGYARITSDPKAAVLVREYLRQREPRLEREEISAMREALFVAAAPAGNYRAVPDVVQRLCIEMCFKLDEQGDRRLLEILDAADSRRVIGDETMYERDLSLVRDGEDPEMELNIDPNTERGPGRGR